ncbi:MAG: AMP-binding protein [Alphaproteobacteria bacterium]
MACLADRAAAAPRGADQSLVIGAQGLRDTAALAKGPSAAALKAGSLAIYIEDPCALIDVLLGLDGFADVLLLISHAQTPTVVAELAQAADMRAVITDRHDLAGPWDGLVLSPGDALADTRPEQDPAHTTRWLMTTSGTTGRPKIIAHTLATLARTVRPFNAGQPPRWGLLYDPTRFAGMQVTLQALIGCGALVAPDTSLPLAEQIAFLAAHGVDHLSATPTLWRRLLMVPGVRALPLRQITLGGEIVDQSVLDGLKAAFPDARITHIYASTEVGVGFAVNDGKAGFPSAYLEKAPGGIAMKLVDGILWFRPPGPRQPQGDSLIQDTDGFICSQDRVRLDGERVMFLGRDNGSINVGGVKVFPELVERLIQTVPGVQLARVFAKASPITGSLLVAEVMTAPAVDQASVKTAILTKCRDSLEREATPAVIRFVDDLRVNAAGKLTRAEGT